MESRVCVVGAGPVGLEMAVRAVRQGLNVCLIERGPLIAANVREWQHVELFSPWSLNISATGKEVLTEMGAAMPDESVFPTGAQLISEYLQVLCDFLVKSGKCRFKFNAELVSIGRGTFLKKEHIGANGRRKGAPFRLLVQSTQSGDEEIITDCNFLVDCTGTWNQPNWCGAGGDSLKVRCLRRSVRGARWGDVLGGFMAGGVPAVGERGLVKKGLVLQHIPDPSLDADKFVGKRVCVVGSGASAITSINTLDRLARSANSTIDLVWVRL